jgi:hypothetical protein
MDYRWHVSTMPRELMVSAARPAAIVLGLCSSLHRRVGRKIKTNYSDTARHGRNLCRINLTISAIAATER